MAGCPSSAWKGSLDHPGKKTVPAKSSTRPSPPGRHTRHKEPERRCTRPGKNPRVQSGGRRTGERKNSPGRCRPGANAPGWLPRKRGILARRWTPSTPAGWRLAGKQGIPKTRSGRTVRTTAMESLESRTGSRKLAAPDQTPARPHRPEIRPRAALAQTLRLQSDAASPRPRPPHGSRPHHAVYETPAIYRTGRHEEQPHSFQDLKWS